MQLFMVNSRNVFNEYLIFNYLDYKMPVFVISTVVPPAAGRREKSLIPVIL